jgi:hypothetical protein
MEQDKIKILLFVTIGGICLFFVIFFISKAATVDSSSETPIVAKHYPLTMKNTKLWGEIPGELNRNYRKTHQYYNISNYEDVNLNIQKQTQTNETELKN